MKLKQYFTMMLDELLRVCVQLQENYSLLKPENLKAVGLELRARKYFTFPSESFHKFLPQKEIIPIQINNSVKVTRR